MPPRNEKTTMNVHEAKTHFSRLLARVENGESIVISRDGKPVAKLVPVRSTEKRVGGQDRGLIVISPDFDRPMSEEEFFGEDE
jgi:prevent-host-death family protein